MRISGFTKSVSQTRMSAGIRGSAFERQAYAENRASAGAIQCLDGPVMRLGDGTANRQPETRAAGTGCPLHFSAIELLENPALFPRLETGSAIANLQHHRGAVGICRDFN